MILLFFFSSEERCVQNRCLKLEWLEGQEGIAFLFPLQVDVFISLVFNYFILNLHNHPLFQVGGGWG